MKQVMIATVCAMVLVLSSVGMGVAQEAGEHDVAKFVEACESLEGAPPGACTCAAEQLVSQISAEDYNALADAWLRGEWQSPGEAEETLGTESVRAVEDAFDACAPQ